MGHCPQCDTYETAVLAMTPGATLDPAVTPCAAYEMSPALREHIVAQMRHEVAGQVAGAGLDRMAVVRNGDASPRTAAGGDSERSRLRGVRLGPGGVPVRRR